MNIAVQAFRSKGRMVVILHDLCSGAVKTRDSENRREAVKPADRGNKALQLSVQVMDPVFIIGGDEAEFLPAQIPGHSACLSSAAADDFPDTGEKIA